MPKKKALSFSQFIKRLPDEDACYEHLYKIKWPNGFECPVCGHRHCYAIRGYRRFQCAKCRHQTSLTANTVMHRSHLPLHNKEIYVEDGIHFNQQGYDIYADFFREVLRDELAKF